MKVEAEVIRGWYTYQVEADYICDCGLSLPADALDYAESHRDEAIENNAELG